MSYPWTDRDSFVADWSKQGEGEDSSQQGLAALLGLAAAWLYFPGHPCTRAASPVPLCCRSSGAGLGPWVLSGSQGAAAEQWGADAGLWLLPGSHTTTGHLQVFPGSLMATCSLPPPRHSLSAMGWSQPANPAAGGSLLTP